MTQHGKTRTQTFRFERGKFAIKTFYYCAKCEMEVDEYQWNEIHSKHPAPTGSNGAALELPKAMVAAA